VAEGVRGRKAEQAHPRDRAAVAGRANGASAVQAMARRANASVAGGMLPSVTRVATYEVA
jgi:hypothetical protein